MASLAIGILHADGMPDGWYGTAFAVSGTDLLSCRHVMCPPSGGEPADTGTVTFADGTRHAVRLVAADAGLDVALLQYVGETPARQNPVTVAPSATRLNDGHHVTMTGWAQFRPFAPDRDAVAAEVVAAALTIHGGQPAIKVQSAEALGGKKMHGLSGGPVLFRPGVNAGVGLGQVAVGIVRSNPENPDGTAHGGVVYATPLSHVLELWPELRELGGPARRAPTSPRIAGFIRHCLRRQDDTNRPFGGRSDTLDRLSAWLHADGPSCCILSAPSGSGKSTLAVRFWQHLVDTEPPETHPIFIPVSVAYRHADEESVLGALVSGLAAVHGDDPAAAAQAGAGTLYDRLGNYLRLDAPSDGHIMVIVDGLDEAFGWVPGREWIDLRDFGVGVKLLVTARQTHSLPDAAAWRDEFRWPADKTGNVELLPLSPRGIREAVRSLRPVVSAALEETATALLHRLTGGDPLVLGLLLEDLQSEPDRAEWLAGRQSGATPGLDGYLESWWRDQETLWGGGTLHTRGEDTRTVYNVLSCAMAPMSENTLLGVCRQLGLRHRDALVNALKDLQRWIIRDPEANTVVLSHARLAEHRRRQLDADEVAAVHKAFARHYRAKRPEWSAEDWRRVDAYAIGSLPAHLAAAGRRDLLHQLLSRERRANDRVANGWHSVTTAAGSVHGFVADVQHAWMQARGDGSAAQMIRYALYLSSLHGTETSLPGPILALCLRDGLLSWPEAWSTIDLQREPLARIQSLAHVAEVPRDEDALQAIEGEILSAQKLPDDNLRGRVLAWAAPMAPDHLVGPLLNAALDSRIDDNLRLAILSAVAERTGPEHRVVATRAARSLTAPVLRARALARLAKAGVLPSRGVAVALRKLAAVGRPGDKVEILAEMAGLPQAPSAAVVRVVAEVKTLSFADGLAPAVGAIAQLNLTAAHREALLARARRRYEAEDVMGSEQAFVATLAALAPGMSDRQREQYLAPVVAMLERLLASPKAFLRKEYRLHLPILAAHLPEPRRTALLREHFSGLLTAATKGDEKGLLPGLLLGMFSAPLPHRWKREGARTALAVLPDEIVAPALEAVGQIRDADDRAILYEVLLPRIPVEKRVRTLAAELQRLRRIGDDGVCDRVLASLVPHLLPQERTAAAIAALPVALGAGVRSHNFRLFTAIEPYLPKAERPAAWRNAIADVRQIESDYFRAQAAATLAPAVPEAELSHLLDVVERTGGNAYLALAPLVARLGPEQRPAAVERVVASIEVNAGEMPEDMRSALPLVAAFLTPEQTGRLRRVVQNIYTARSWQAPDGFAGVVEERRDRAPLVRPRRPGSTDEDRAIELRDSIPSLSEVQRLAALDEMLRCCLGVRLVQTFGGTKFFADLDRAFLLRCIRQTTPYLPDSASEVAHAIRDCARWWP